MDVTILLRISKLFNQQSSSVRNGLKVTLSRGSQIKRHFFTWGGGETKDRAKVSMSPLFEGLLINNNELRDNPT